MQVRGVRSSWEALAAKSRRMLSKRLSLVTSYAYPPDGSRWDHHSSVDLTIPAGRIARLEQRKLDRRRTWLTAGVGGAAVAAILTSFGEGVPNPELPPVEEDPAGFTALRAAISLVLIRAR